MILPVWSAYITDGLSVTSVAPLLYRQKPCLWAGVPCSCLSILSEDIRSLLKQMSTFSASSLPSSLLAPLSRYLASTLDWMPTDSVSPHRQVQKAAMCFDSGHGSSALTNLLFPGPTVCRSSVKASYRWSRYPLLQHISCGHLEMKRLTSSIASRGGLRKAHSRTSWDCTTPLEIYVIQSWRSRFVPLWFMSSKWTHCCVRTGCLETLSEVENLPKYTKNLKTAYHFLSNMSQWQRQFGHTFSRRHRLATRPR